MKTLLLLAQALFLIGQVQADAFKQVRITSVSVYDNLSSTASPSIDVVQDICGRVDQNGDDDTTDEGDVLLETLSDVLLSVDVTNPTQKTIFVGSLKYKVKDRGDGRRMTTKALSAVSPVEIAPKATGTVQFLFIRGVDGQKYFHGSEVPITALGFTNIEVQVITRDASRLKRTLRKKTALSFGNFDNCN